MATVAAVPLKEEVMLIKLVLDPEQYRVFAHFLRETHEVESERMLGQILDSDNPCNIWVLHPKENRWGGLVRLVNGNLGLEGEDAAKPNIVTKITISVAEEFELPDPEAPPDTRNKRFMTPASFITAVCRAAGVPRSLTVKPE